MEIDALASGASSAATQSNSKLAESFDTFLTLLTTQLQNQDPLDPLDSAEFTQQLVMFTQAEQSIATNKNLEDLISLAQNSTATGALGYLNTTITANGSKTALVNGSATWSYDLPVNAAEVGITIKDEDGATIATGTGDSTKGTHTFEWDGTSDTGVPQPDGIYEIQVSALDANGAVVATTTQIQGIVDGIEVDDGSVILTVGALSVPIEEVISVGQPSSSTEEEQTASDGEQDPPPEGENPPDQEPT